MAITGLHYNLLRQLKSAGILPQGGTVLEIGEANWYGDTNPEVLWEHIDQMPEGEAKDKALAMCKTVMLPIEEQLFSLAKLVYQIVMAPSKVVSIDMHGTPDALKLDLNHPIDVPNGERFDVVFNHGTLEHVFNAAEGYRTIHYSTKPGGLMIHEAPLTGWVDHGLLHPQPGLFFDLALANKYEIILYAIECLKEQKVIQIHSREDLHKQVRDGRIPDNAMSFVVFKKTADKAFQIPIQGLYAGTISPEAQQSWHDLR